MLKTFSMKSHHLFRKTITSSFQLFLISNYEQDTTHWCKIMLKLSVNTTMPIQLCIRQYEYITMVTESYHQMLTSFAQPQHQVIHIRLSEQKIKLKQYQCYYFTITFFSVQSQTWHTWWYSEARQIRPTYRCNKIDFIQSQWIDNLIFAQVYNSCRTNGSLTTIHRIQICRQWVQSFCDFSHQSTKLQSTWTQFTMFTNSGLLVDWSLMTPSTQLRLHCAFTVII